MSRKAHDASRIDGAGEIATGFQERLERLSRFVVCNDDDNWLARGTRYQWQVQGARCSGESGYTSPPRSQAQVPAYAIKSRSLLQLRKDFADKRENHPMTV